MEKLDVVVAGAGVIGLAVARALAMAGRNVFIVEAQAAIGTQTSARNSEVIHAGIYYPQGSLKARLCVEGRHQLYRHLEATGVEHRRCGKLIVATTEAQRAALDQIACHAAANGVDDLVRLEGAEARAMEPALHAVAALYSPSTGIIDSHGYMLSLLAEAESHGALLALCSPITRGQVTGDGIALHIEGDEPIEVLARTFVNCAGLQAPALARRISGIAPDSIPLGWLCKGNYFSLTGRSPFSRLIYPVPEPGGLGVHLTLDLAGGARFGPDVEWLPDTVDPWLSRHDSPSPTSSIDYAVDPGRGERFYGEVRRYWPDLADGQLAPAYSGVRPKASSPRSPAADFLIQGSEAHSVAGYVGLYGIESPGLTASLAIADHVAAIARAQVE
jgi:L-2-hydroxyglutarate oxidase LhgO